MLVTQCIILGKENNMRLKVEDISSYRQALMGFAIFAVMFSHWFGFQSISDGIPYKVSTIFTKFVFTEGLLFLSGFGLFFSFSKNSDIKDFYKRRLIRLYIPFFLLSLPLYTYFLFAREGYGLLDYFGQLTTTFFWFEGNYGGMWYVSLSLFLYLLFPFIFNFIFLNKDSLRSVITRTVLLLIFVYLILWTVWLSFPDYYNMVEIGLSKIPFFIIGILFGYWTCRERIKQPARTLDVAYLFFIICCVIIFATLSVFNHRTTGYWLGHATGLFQKLSFSLLLCVLLSCIDGNKIGHLIIKPLNWMGKYSLELYILHLHFYMFFHFGFLKNDISVATQASLAVLLALVLCVPVNKAVGNLVNIVVGKRR